VPLLLQEKIKRETCVGGLEMHQNRFLKAPDIKK
jgi:hypothetical protein